MEMQLGYVYMMDKEASNGGVVMHCCCKCTGSGFHQDFFFCWGHFIHHLHHMSVACSSKSGQVGSYL